MSEGQLQQSGGENTPMFGTESKGSVGWGIGRVLLFTCCRFLSHS
jgi:hypothetical protein